MVLNKVLRNPVSQLSILLIAVFFLQTYSASQGIAEDYFVLQYPLDQHTWTVIVAVFAHSGFSHLSSNLTGLILFGLPVAWNASRIRFYLFFLFTGSIAAVSQIITSEYLYSLGVYESSSGGVLGASGAIFALIGYLITSNRVSGFISEYIFLSNKIRILLYISVAGWITLATASPQTALVGHFTGLILGLVAGKKNLLKANDEEFTSE